jgi:hypothetical protein
MDKLQQLITPDVYGYHDLVQLGWPAHEIQQYTEHRSYKWNIACQVFAKLFPGTYVYKEFDKQNKCMIVTVVSGNNTLCTQRHNDPLFALAECAKKLNNEDDFISALFEGLNI